MFSKAIERIFLGHATVRCTNDVGKDQDDIYVLIDMCMASCIEGAGLGCFPLSPRESQNHDTNPVVFIPEKRGSEICMA